MAGFVNDCSTILPGLVAAFRSVCRLDAGWEVVQRFLKQHFDRVVVQENKGEFNSLEGLQAAVADLYLLASSIYMLKPYWSSFPEMAQALAGTDFLAEDSRSEDLFKDGKLNVKLPNDPIKPFLKDCLYNQGDHKSFD